MRSHLDFPGSSVILGGLLLLLPPSPCVATPPVSGQVGQGPCSQIALEHELALADSLLSSRHFSEALAAYERLRACGDSPEVPDSLAARFHRDYGWALARCDSTESAGRYLAQALAEWTAVAGDTSAGYGIALERFARWTAATGDFASAHRDFLRSWHILVESLGPDHRETLWAEHGLAQALDYFQHREAAAEHMAHVFAVRSRTLSAQDLDLAWTCHDYAIILHALGRLPLAEDLYRQAYESRRGRLPALFCETGWGYAICLAAEGDYREALRVMAEVDEVLQDHPKLQKRMAVGTAATAADIARRLGYLQGAERFENRFRQMVEKYGVDQHTWNRNRSVTAYLLEHKGSLQAAIDTLQVRLSVLQDTYGEDSPLTAPELARLARLKERLGRASEADSLVRMGLASADPVEEPALFGALASGYIEFLVRCGRLSAAEHWVDLALASVDLLPRAHSVRSGVDEAVGQLRLAQGDPRAAWEFAHRAASATLRRYQLNLQVMTSEQISAYWTQEIASMDLLLTVLGEEDCAEAAFVEAAWALTMTSRGSLLDELSWRREAGEEPDTLRAMKRRLAGLLTLDPLNGLEPSSQGQLHRLNSDIAQLEERLAAARSENPPRPPLDVEALLEALPPKATLLAYVQYRSRGVSHYGAFVLRPGTGAHFQDLGEAEVVDSLIACQRDLMADAPEEVIFDPDGAEAAYRKVGFSLRRLLLDAALGDPLPRDLVVILTGPLWDVNLLALPRGTTAYLVEELASLRLVESEREFIASGTGPTGGGLLAAGGVDYSGWASGSPEALPASLDEVERVRSFWQKNRAAERAELLTGKAVQEDVVPDRLEGRRVLHLATHAVTWTDALTGELCAGLRLAKPPAGTSGFDGIWTEREIALENFSSVELVFLSSCRSLEGTALPGERLAGLYRAFRLAGARSAVLSQWDVGDRPSRDWCLRFYDQLLTRNATASHAAFLTSSETLRVRRSSGRPTHPYYWACFLAVGN